MHRKLIVFIVTLFLILNLNIVASDETDLLPVKKPKLTEKELNKKILINILKPLPKPILIVKEAPAKKIVKKEIIKPKFLLPKKKPLIAGSKKTQEIKLSKYYNKKDFSLANKAISEMKKAKWVSALKTAKKAKDKSIYNFIQWRHLLTKGNQATYYDYKTFIDKNEDYPRIGRIKYLAEHKMSLKKKF